MTDPKYKGIPILKTEDGTVIDDGSPPPPSAEMPPEMREKFKRMSRELSDEAKRYREQFKFTPGEPDSVFCDGGPGKCIGDGIRRRESGRNDRLAVTLTVSEFEALLEGVVLKCLDQRSKVMKMSTNREKIDGKSQTSFGAALKPSLDRVKSEDDKWRRYAVTALSHVPEGTAEEVATHAVRVADAMMAQERERCAVGDDKRAGKPSLSQKLDEWFAEREAHKHESMLSALGMKGQQNGD